MYYVLNERNGKEIHDSRINTATTDYIVNQLELDEPAIFLGIHKPTVMIGRYQNAYAEVDQRYLEENDIVLVRRLSGGGAVYHDMGNIMCLLTGPNINASQKKYPEYSKPFLDAISELGIDEVHASGRNDLLIGEHKFSGTSFYATPKHFMFGATISYDLDVEAAQSVLKPNKKKLTAHRTKSVGSRMTNVKEHMPEQYAEWTTQQFRDYLVCHIFGVDTLDKVKTYQLTETDWAAIDQIAAEKFQSDDWNWGQRNDFTLHHSQRFSSGTYDFYGVIENGVVKEAKIHGDFFAKQALTPIETALVNVEFQPSAIRSAFEGFASADYIEDLTIDNLLDLLFKEEEEVIE